MRFVDDQYVVGAQQRTGRREVRKQQSMIGHNYLRVERPPAGPEHEALVSLRAPGAHGVACRAGERRAQPGVEQFRRPGQRIQFAGFSGERRAQPATKGGGVVPRGTAAAICRYCLGAASTQVIAAAHEREARH